MARLVVTAVRMVTPLTGAVGRLTRMKARGLSGRRPKQGRPLLVQRCHEPLLQLSSNPLANYQMLGTQSGITTTIALSFSTLVVDTDSAYSSGVFTVPANKGGWHEVLVSIAGSQVTAAGARRERNAERLLGCLVQHARRQRAPKLPGARHLGSRGRRSLSRTGMWTPHLWFWTHPADADAHGPQARS